MTVSLRKMQLGPGLARECGLYLKFLSGGNLPGFSFTLFLVIQVSEFQAVWRGQSPLSNTR
jgi:hypothetical protein